MAAPVGLTKTRSSAHDAGVDAVVRRVHREILAGGDHIGRANTAALRARVETCAPLLSRDQIDDAVAEVTHLLFGFGPLESLFVDPEITEVMVNGPGFAWIERAGQLMPSDVQVDASMLALIIERIVGPLGLRVDRTAPFVDARLIDGSRVHIAVPPLAIDGPYLTIRRFRDDPFSLDDFCPDAIADVLATSVSERASLIVSGGTGTGKTSLLNALAAHIPASERVITIEDAAELRLPGDHTLRLESRPANAEGVGGVSIRTLVRNALRMRPDRIVVGEVRGAEALDMMQAMNTGHEGSMSTCHANSPRDAMRRLEAMVLMSDVALPLPVVRSHLSAALDLVVHVERMGDGRRRIRAVERHDDGAVTQVVSGGRLT